MANKLCSVNGCDTKHYGLGLCNKHYSRLKRHGDINFEMREYHGGRKKPEYIIWHNMLRRCYDKARAGYKYWGGRGIEVCEEWRTSFSKFLADVGERPSPELTLDRIDNNGNYEPGNVRWATRAVQSRNRSNVI